MYTFKPSGVCAREITYDIQDGRVVNIEFLGGCNGNGKGIAALAEGMTPGEIVKRLTGITCKQKTTSCPAQLAKALIDATEQMDKEVENMS